MAGREGMWWWLSTRRKSIEGHEKKENLWVKLLASINRIKLKGEAVVFAKQVSRQNTQKMIVVVEVADGYLGNYDNQMKTVREKNPCTMSANLSHENSSSRVILTS